MEDYLDENPVRLETLVQQDSDDELNDDYSYDEFMRDQRLFDLDFKHPIIEDQLIVSNEDEAEEDPLTPEELELYQSALVRIEKQERERIKREREDRLNKELENAETRIRWRNEINEWKKSRGIVNPELELPTMPLVQEYQLLLDDYAQKRDEQKREDARIALIAKQKADAEWVALRRTRKKAGGDLDKIAQKRLLLQPKKAISAKPLYSQFETNPITQVKQVRPITQIEPSLPEIPSVLRFSWGSLDTEPTLGEGESGNKADFYKLGRVPDWRKKLSVLWKSPFVLDGKRWQTVEHYIQYKKFARNSPEFAHLFSMDSNSEFSTYPLMARSVGDRTGSWRGRQIRPDSVRVDAGYFGNVEKYLILANFAKFSQDQHLGYLLADTKNAELWEADGKRKRAYYLEKVRNCLNQIYKNKLEMMELSSDMLG